MHDTISRSPICVTHTEYKLGGGLLLYGEITSDDHAFTTAHMKHVIWKEW